MSRAPQPALALPAAGPCLVLGPDRWRLLAEVNRAVGQTAVVRRDASWSVGEAKRWVASHGGGLDLFGDASPSAYVLDLVGAKADEALLPFLAEQPTPGLWLWGAAAVPKAWAALPTWTAPDLTWRTLPAWLRTHAAPPLTHAWSDGVLQRLGPRLTPSPQQPGRLLHGLLQLELLLEPTASDADRLAAADTCWDPAAAHAEGDAESLIWREGGRVAGGGPSAGAEAAQWLWTHHCIRRHGGQLTLTQARLVARLHAEVPQ